MKTSIDIIHENKVKKIKEENRMAYILFGIRKWEEVSRMIYKLWHLRKILLKPP